MSDFAVVNTTLGGVRGVKVKSARSGFYYKFQGIPYAKPPIGELRFQAPQAAEPWTGVRDALKEGPSCPSYHMLTQQYIESSNEDCLYLNVYIPENMSYVKKAVLFWIHGGGFMRGSGDSDMYGPDYLITEDVVVVTCNYRVAALGFLSLENEVCPGNNGLKDIVHALKWVKENISNFGGDPDNVTIFGESAGGAIVSYLMLSPLSKGLFHRAISQSGSAISPWALAKSPKKFAFELANRLGFKSKNEEELLQFLKNAPVKDIIDKQDPIQTILDPYEHHGSLPFVPCIEPKGLRGAFIDCPPIEYLKKGLIHDVSYMMGACTLEGLIYINGQPPMETDEDFTRLLPADMIIDRKSKKAKEIAKKLKAKYFPNGFTKEGYIHALTNSYFTNGIVNYIDYVIDSKRKSPVYSYVFTYDGGKPTFKKILLGQEDISGTCHADELGYLFHHNIFDEKLEDNLDLVMVKVITKLWTNFAKTGNPTCEKTNEVSIDWKPSTNMNKFYMDIGERLILKENMYKEDTNLWNALYTQI